MASLVKPSKRAILDVFGHHIGSYRACEKWLKERRGRTLSCVDVEHYWKALTTLKETIRLKAEIDAAIPNRFS